MASFADLSANLKLNISNFSQNLAKASGDVKRFGKNINGQVNDASDAMVLLNKKTTAWGLNVKSVSRVVSGILISQAFYSMVQAITGATKSVWEFTKQLEYAQIAYSNLFGDTSLALEFINVLKDFAAKTPFTFTESEAAAKRLLAYGVQYKNVMYIMQGIMSAASAQGDPQRVEQISRAIGQIFTYGKLMSSEVRQLTEAGIPVYDILQEKLGLTQEQLRNLGHEAIPASEAINALIDGINERFGNVVAASSKTITGIISNIKDNATMLTSSLFQPLTVVIKSALAALGDFLFTLRDVAELSGAGGVFEALFPANMHGVLRQFVANFKAIHASVFSLFYAISSVLKPALEAVLRVFNAFTPILTMVTNALAAIVYAITSNATAMKVLTMALAAAAAMWVLFTARALAAKAISLVIVGISKALSGLAVMLTFVASHPFWVLLAGITGILVGISGGFGALSDKVNNFFKSLTKFNGIDPDKVLLPSQKDRANDLDKFNNKLEGTSDAMDELADSTGKATKAAKGLLSFDEVFKLNEPDEGAGSGGIQNPAMEDLLGGFDGLGGAYIPEVPDFSAYVDSFVGGLKDAWEKIKEKAVPIISGGLGAILGGILGGLLGGPIGAKIGAVIGGLVGGLWGMLADKLGVVPTQHFATIANAIGTGLLHFLRRFTIELVEGLVPTFVDDAFVGFSKMAGFSLARSFGAALKQGFIGAVVSLGVGILSNALSAWIAKELDLTDADLKNAGVGQIAGNIVGTITGLILGGPIGSLVGGAFGQLAGSIVGEFWSYLGTTLQSSILGGVAGLPIGALVGTIVGSVGGPLGAALGATIGAAIGAALSLVVENWGAISSFFTNVANGIVDTYNGIVDFVKNVGDTISAKWNEITTNVSTVMGTIWTVISTVWTDINQAIRVVQEDIYMAVSTVWNDCFKAVQTVVTDIYNAVSKVWSDILNATSTVFNGIWSLLKDIWTLIEVFITGILGTIWNEVDKHFGWIFDIIELCVTSAFNVIKQMFTNAYENIKLNVTAAFAVAKLTFGYLYESVKTSVTDTFNTVKQYFLDIYNSIRGNVTLAYNIAKKYFSDLYSTIKDNVTYAINIVRENFGAIYTEIKNKVTDSYNSVKKNFGDMYSSIKNNIGDMYREVKDGLSNMYKAFTDWISDMWNNVFNKLSKWISDAIEDLQDFFKMKDKAEREEKSSSSSSKSSGSSSTRVNYATSSGPASDASLKGHATGGIFNREHVARFAEGNKAEAIIPLENESAMQPFVDALSRGIIEGLAPTLVTHNSTGSANNLPPMYVGTLIADDRGLKQLYKKFELIQVQENARRGLT